MEVASTVIQHISDKKSELSIELETTTLPDTLPFTWRAWFIPRCSTLLYHAILVYWIITEQNGFSNSIPSIITPSTDSTANGYIGYHALGLSIWAVLANQETIMAFAIPLHVTSAYPTRKIIHIVSQVIGLLCGIGGMIAILWYKKSTIALSVSGTSITVPLLDEPFYIPYSPHAWIGIIFMGAWIIQCVGRFFPNRFTINYHRFFGRILYTTGLICCCLGIQQQQTRQLVSTITSITNTTLTSTRIASKWWFSQPSLAVVLLCITGASTFFYGLL